MKNRESQYSKILAHNLRTLRHERGLTQEQISEKAELSLRLYQQLERGRGNPTITTITSIAEVLQVALQTLLSLRVIRTKLSREEFIEKYKKSFEKKKLAVCIRDLEGVVQYLNPAADEVVGGAFGEFKKPIPLMEVQDVRGKELLRAQLSAEKSGLALPYVNLWNTQSTNERFYIRFFPCLIYPLKGTVPYFSAVYYCEVTRGTDKDYYDFCNELLGMSLDE